MNIKTRILLSVIVLQIAGFSVLLMHYNHRAHKAVLNFNRTQVNATVTATALQLDAMAAQMERTAVGMARSGEHLQEIHHRHDLSEVKQELQRLLLRTLSTFAAASGGGIWYEPFALSHDEKRVGPYAQWHNNQLQVIWERESAAFNYHAQPWYQLAIPEDWPRNEYRPDTFYWTAPYADDQQQTMLTVAVPMYNEQQQLLGVATIDWSVDHILSALNNLHLATKSTAVLYDPGSQRYLSEHKLKDSQPLAEFNQTSGNQTDTTHVKEITTDNGDFLFIAQTKTGLLIAVYIPCEELVSLVSRFLAQGLSINTGIALVFIAIMFILLDILFRPFDQILQRLRNAININRNAERITFIPIQYSANNEFTPIVETFNVMGGQVLQFTDRLYQANVQLQAEQNRAAELNETLELKVTERTNELAEKNREANESLHMLKLMQQQLVTLEKHAALGDIVAGLAHEINTPLGISVTAVSALDEHFMELEQHFRHEPLSSGYVDDFVAFSREGMTIALNNLHRAADLINRFRQVAVDQASEQKRDVELCDYLNSILSSLRPSYRYRPVDVDLQCRKAVVITTYPGALAQILTNLIINSLTHAFPVDNDQPDQRGHILIQVEQQGDDVQIIYRDDGRGMSEDVCRQLFEPFFTTRPQQGGSGLGAYIIHDLVTSQLQGSIRVNSHPGEGSEFIILLPRRMS